MTDVVVCSLEPWDQIWRRNQFLVAGLIRQDPALRVLFIEPAADPLYSVLTRRFPRPGAGLRNVLDVDGIAPGRLWAFQPTKWLPRTLGDVDDRIAMQVVATSRRLGMEDAALWINDPAAVSVLRATSWPALYDITDDWLHAHRSERQLRRLRADEEFLMARSTVVTVCSTALQESKGRLRDVVLIPNAVDVARFRTPRPRPDDLPDGRIAMYVGTVHTDRMDVELTVQTAQTLTDTGSGTLVLVGPMLLPEQLQRRIAAAGGVILGARSYAVVPAYLQHADVLVVPHVVDDFTDSLDPIKLYEYQAVGGPVVATPVAGFRDLDSNLVSVADKREFPGAVLVRIMDARPSNQSPVPLPTWDDRVTDMAAVLGRLADLA